MAGGEATWHQDQLVPIYRNGRHEDVYWSFSYSPVSDDTGQVGGVLVVGQETTAVVNSFRQLAHKAEANQRLIAYTPDVITRWGKDLRLLFANAAFERETGIDNALLLGKTNREMGEPEFISRPYETRLQAVLDDSQP